MLCVGSVQEAHDFALIAHAATLEPRAVPALLRRLPDLARGQQDRAARRRRPARDDRRRRWSGAPRPRARPRSAGRSAAPRRTPTCSSRPARRATRSTTPCPAIVQQTMDEFAALHRPAVPPVRLRRRARRRARRRRHGLGGGRDRGDGRGARWRAARRSALLKVRLFRPFAAAAFIAALPPTHAAHRRARPDQGAGRGRRAALPGRGRGARRGAGQRRARRSPRCPRSSAAATGCRRRSSRRRWSRPSSRSWPRRSPKRHFTVGIIDDVTHLSLPVDPTFTTEPADVDRGGLLRPGQRRHGRGQQELGEDHRREHRRCTPRATSSTTRRSRARSRSRTCASARGRSARPT